MVIDKTKGRVSHSRKTLNFNHVNLLFLAIKETFICIFLHFPFMVLQGNVNGLFLSFTLHFMVFHKSVIVISYARNDQVRVLF